MSHCIIIKLALLNNLSCSALEENKAQWMILIILLIRIELGTLLALFDFFVMTVIYNFVEKSLEVYLFTDIEVVEIMSQIVQSYKNLVKTTLNSNFNKLIKWNRFSLYSTEFIVNQYTLVTLHEILIKLPLFFISVFTLSSFSSLLTWFCSCQLYIL